MLVNEDPKFRCPECHACGKRTMGVVDCTAGQTGQPPSTRSMDEICLVHHQNKSFSPSWCRRSSALEGHEKSPKLQSPETAFHTISSKSASRERLGVDLDQFLDSTSAVEKCFIDSKIQQHVPVELQEGVVWASLCVTAHESSLSVTGFGFQSSFFLGIVLPSFFSVRWFSWGGFSPVAMVLCCHHFVLTDVYLDLLVYGYIVALTFAKGLGSLMPRSSFDP